MTRTEAENALIMGKHLNPDYVKEAYATLRRADAKRVSAAYEALQQPAPSIDRAA